MISAELWVWIAFANIALKKKKRPETYRLQMYR